VLGEEEADVLPGDAEEEREGRAKAVLELHLKAEAAVPLSGGGGVANPQDGIACSGIMGSCARRE
jgi:hypothetical protein